MKLLKQYLSRIGGFLREWILNSGLLVNLAPAVIGPYLGALGSASQSQIYPEKILEYLTHYFSFAPKTDAQVALEVMHPELRIIPWLIICAPFLIGSLLALRLESLFPTRGVGLLSRLRSNSFIMALIAAHAVAFLPFLLLLLSVGFGIPRLSCAQPRMIDFTWLAYDSIAKGLLLDFMESFHLDLHTDRCRPLKESWGTSTIIFLLRGFSTYVVVWLLYRLSMRFLPLMRAKLMNIGALTMHGFILAIPAIVEPYIKGDIFKLCALFMLGIWFFTYGIFQWEEEVDPIQKLRDALSSLAAAVCITAFAWAVRYVVVLKTDPQGDWVFVAATIFGWFISITLLNRSPLPWRQGARS